MYKMVYVEGFEWDEGNREKNLLKHRVTTKECEEVFFHTLSDAREDTGHSQGEYRFTILGKTSEGRRLYIVFTIRNSKIRVISARDQSKKERRLYENKKSSA